MLTAADSTEELVEGLDLGADDYLAKPVVLAELGARLRALMRRAASPRQSVLVRGDLVLDSGARSVSRAGRPLRLTGREFDLLESLLRADGRVLSSNALRRRPRADGDDAQRTGNRAVSEVRLLRNPASLVRVEGSDVDELLMAKLDLE